MSRTPTQVASHAQKYFIRLNSMNKKDKRRSSIHDITSASESDVGVAVGAHGAAAAAGTKAPAGAGAGAGGAAQYQGFP